MGSMPVLSIREISFISNIVKVHQYPEMKAITITIEENYIDATCENTFLVLLRTWF